MTANPGLVQLVNAHDTVVVNFHNYQDTQLIILKKDNQTGLPLAGARFMVTTAGGNFIADLVTGSTGYATLNGLEPGSYVVKEVEAPDGHIIDSTPQTFELRVGQTEPVFLVFGNDGKTTLYIRKEDEQTRLPVAGAVFKLSRVNGEVIKERLETAWTAWPASATCSPATMWSRRSRPRRDTCSAKTPSRMSP